MKNYNRALLIVLIFAVNAKAQLSFTVQILPTQQNLSPVPFRDNIPAALVKAPSQDSSVNTTINLLAPVPKSATTANKPVAASNQSTVDLTKTQAVSTNTVQPTLTNVPKAQVGLKIEQEEETSNSKNVPDPGSTQSAQVAREKKIKISLENLNVLKPLADFKVKALASPKSITLPNFSVEKEVTAKKVFDKNQNVPQVVAELEKAPAMKIEPDNVTLEKLIVISQDEYKLIQALLLLEFQKKADTAMALFVDLMTSSQFRLQATYHYAEIAFSFGLYNEFKTKMLGLFKNKGEHFFRKKAAESLIKNAIAIHSSDLEEIEPVIDEYNLAFEHSDYYLLKRGQYYSEEADLHTAESSLFRIPPKSEVANSARLLISTIKYRQGELNAAIKALEPNMLGVAQLPKTDKIRNLSYLTMARYYFQKSQFKEAYAQYLKVDKSSGFWLQASQEQAITQILFGDHVGAAGNMFSLHTDYFKKAWAPDSYIVRAIGYLNLCQYGDAVHVVSDLHRRYSKPYEQITQFKQSANNSTDYYGLIKELFGAQQSGDVRGLPRPFVIELARHPKFISTQKLINSIEEEIGKFSNVIQSLNTSSTRIKQQRDQNSKTLADLRAKSQNPSLQESLERQIMAADSELNIAAAGRTKIEKMRAEAAVKMVGEKNKLKTLANSVLNRSFNSQYKSLTDIMEQKDVLAYDIYSGAGEHLRMQMAGGPTKERNPADSALTPEEKKSYRWQFKGEVWEDEVGHYRSSLTNVCSKDDYAQNAGGK